MEMTAKPIVLEKRKKQFGGGQGKVLNGRKNSQIPEARTGDCPRRILYRIEGGALPPHLRLKICLR